MKTQSSRFTQTQLAGLISAYFNGTNYIGIEDSDLLSASLPAGVTGDPFGAIRKINAGFTCPSKFFGAHTRNLDSIAALGAAGCKTFRLRDTGCSWWETVAKQADVTFTAGSTNTVNWTASGADPDRHCFAAYTASSFPSGLTQLQLYYIVNATANTFQLSLTPGGAPINLGTAGSTNTGMLINRSVMSPAGDGRLDQLVNAANAAGMDIIYGWERPPLSITNGSTDSNGRPNTIPTASTYVNKWMQLLVARYGAKITHYEVWNEPNDPTQFAGTISGTTNDLKTFASWLKNARDAYAASVQIIGPSWNIVTGAAAMNTWLASPSSGAALIDIVGCHNYRGGTVQLGYDNAAVDAYLAGAAANAPGKEVWITEVGESYPTAEILWRAHAYAMAKGIARMLWYSYDLAAGLGDMRLSSYDGLPAAYRDMVSRCAGQTISYVNQCYDRRVGIGVGSWSSVF